MKSTTHTWLLLAVVTVSFSVFGHCLQAQEGKLDPQAPYSAKRSNPVTYQVDFSVVVTPPYHTDKLKVWLPMPQSDAGQEVTEGDISSFPLKVKPTINTEPAFGNRFAYFEFDHPQGAQIIRHRFQVKAWELRWQIDPAQVKPIAKWPDAFQPYLRSEKNVVEYNEEFDRLLAGYLPQKTNTGTDFLTALECAQRSLKYDHNQASLAASSAFALENRTGHCSDYHGFCAAMGRMLGYPTRVTYGINPFPKNSPSHCKLEAYLPPYGWVSFDVSETQKLMKDIAKATTLSAEDQKQLQQAALNRMFQGFRDNTWFLQTRGTDYELAPPASRRVPVVRTIYAEADGVALPDPDPSNSEKREFAWMTIHQYQADQQVPYPFKDWKTLQVTDKNTTTP